jgi:endonuclease YncB( thermonuclease family)
VSDGDTITVLDDNHTQHKIRLAGIDAPESKQAFGQRSKESLVKQVVGQDVMIDWSKIDKYQRKVGKVMLDGQDINLAQVRRGFAWHYKAYQGEQSAGDRVAYAEAEDAARGAHRGLWKDELPVPPWDFRHNK